jgi:hemerythrin
MKLLHWKNDYSAGIETVDHGHRELIDLINRLHDEADNALADRPASKFFSDLLTGISAHFALEECIMLDRGFSRLASHKDDHERLLDELREMMDAYEQADDVDLLELTTRFDQWFSRHFRTYDAEFMFALGGYIPPKDAPTNAAS